MEYTGLTTKQAQENLEKFGKNEIIDVNKTSWFTILLRQVKGNFIVFLLFAATVLSFIVGKSVTGYTVLLVIVLVVGVGFLQEYKAEKAVSALKKMITPTTLVIRNSKEQEIPSDEIVPGDILVLRTGEKVPADCLIIDQKHLLVNESVLTGESKAIQKIIAKDKNYKHENLVFMGSFIVSGKCLVKTIHTGMNTRFGQIAGMISTAEKELPLQIKINQTLKYLVFVGLFFAILTGLVVLFKSPAITSSLVVDVIILVIAISVAAFPEGLPVVLVSCLSVGAYRMAKKNAIVNRMSIIETLGETTVICSDKTGTITKGEMTVRKIFVDNDVYDVSGVGYEAKGQILKFQKKINPKENKQLYQLLKSSLLCNDARVKEIKDEFVYNISGNPTEAALIVLSAKANIFKEDLEVVRQEEIPFSSENKFMSVLVSENKEQNVYVKGAVEILLNKCDRILKNNKEYKITQKDKKKILEQNKKFTKKSLRTLGFAYKAFDKNLDKNLVFVGFVGMEDPPREEVKETISLCKKAGIKVKMITGDNKETALSIAKEIGLDKGEVLEGKDIDKLTDDELIKIINDVVVFARVNPEHKLRIVKSLKANKEIVTMTGDGVNDAPALKEAHVGVAMGINGTDVSRSVADLTLKDDNFATIVHAVKEGRTIFTNIRKFMTYQFSCNLSQLGIIVFGVMLADVFSWPIPLLLPLQILFMNIVTDNLPAIALSFNPSSDDVMSGKIHTKKILTKNLVFLLFFSSTLMILFSLSVFYISFNIYNHSSLFASTTALVILILLQIFGAFVFRSFRKGVLTRSPFVNKYLFGASLISIIATIVIIYTPINKIFETTPLPFSSWLLVLGVGLFYVLIFDVLKIINKKKSFWSIE